MRFPLLVLVVIFSAAGCSDGTGRLSISGRVAYKGKDVKEGTIQFFPKDQATGDATGAMIRDGKYVIDAAHGLPVGDYVVRISVPDFKGKRPDPNALPGAPYLAAELLPERYNQKSTLTISLKNDRTKSTHDFLLD